MNGLIVFERSFSLNKEVSNCVSVVQGMSYLNPCNSHPGAESTGHCSTGNTHWLATRGVNYIQVSYTEGQTFPAVKVKL